MKAFVFSTFLACALAATGRADAAGEGALALVGAKIRPSPDGAEIVSGVVLIRDATIVAVGPEESIEIPPGSRTIDCTGLTLTAGFWNCHVHFFRPEWIGAAEKPAPELATRLREMLTRFGYTSVFDVGSFLENTIALRGRIESGEIDGPTILTTGPPIFAKGGTPREISGAPVSEVDTVEEARRIAKDMLDRGADGIKAYVYSPTGAPGSSVMRPELIRAMVDEAHARGKPVFAHPENPKGLRAALEGGVDVLAHAIEEGGPWDAETVAELRRANVALVPTLRLYAVGSLVKWKRSEAEAESYVARCGVLEQLRDFSKAGGPVLFGTDVGFYDPLDMTGEYRLMSRAGLDWKAILASLTTAPAEQFATGKRTGRVEPGYDADLVLLAGDPAEDVEAFGKVHLTIRKGKVIYEVAK